MLRFLPTCLVLIAACSASANAERLVLGQSAIYREATDDYEFRLRFSYDLEHVTAPDVSIYFGIIGRRPQDGLLGGIAYVADWSLHDDVPAEFVRYTPSPIELISTYDSVINGNTVSIIVPRTDVAMAGDIDLLFPYTVRASTLDGSQEYQIGIPNPLTVQLNVPEPSSVVLATLAVAQLTFVRYKFARGRPLIRNQVQ